jgi:Protein of unknown function (DUF3618)
MNSNSSPQPDTADAIRADIEQTRQQLGETVEALAAKADVKARAQDKVSELSDRVTGSLAVGKDRAVEAGKHASKVISDKASTGNLPEPAQQAASRASSFVRKYPGQIAAAFAAIAALIVVRARRSR